VGGAERIGIVALVASAGGLDALSVVLRGLPDDLPAAVVVQQHLGGRGSALVPILQRQTRRDVVWAEDGSHAAPGVVTVCPPRTRMEFFPDGAFALQPTPDGARGFPHDALLRSLADSFGARVLAVVLTGMGRDGAAGTAALKAAGGVVIAQSEDTAEQPSMPKAAADAGADLVLPLHEIGAVVAGVVRGGPLPLPRTELDAVRELFGGRSIMEGVAREIDWARTPLGPVTGWGPALRTMVQLVMATPTPLTLLWGDQHIALYNDGAIEQRGAKHHEQFALPHLEAEPAYARVRGGEPVHLRDSRQLVERRGTPQHAWFDISYSPVRDEHGDIAGILQSAHERTSEVLSARRLRTLNRLAATPASHGRREALATALAVLGPAADLGFAAAYLLDMPGKRAGLVAAAGIEEGGAMAPRELRLVPGAAWPLRQAVEAGKPVWLDDLRVRFRGHLLEGEPVSPERAVLHPLHDQAQDTVVGVLVLGMHPRLPLDDGYREFLTVAAETIAAKVSESHARHQERCRLEALAELDRTKTEFFSNVSHEFRTPLTLMLGPLEDLLQNPADPILARRDDIELMQRNARRLLRLVGTLLDFSESRNGRLPARFTPLDLAALTTDIASAFHGAAEAAGLKLAVESPPLPEPVWVDPEMWEKIVANLVANALKFTWEGRVDVTLRALPKHAELVVRDTGVGIPAEQLPYVFQRFHRVPDTSGRSNEGAGIGLALVDELVRRQHGRVRVTSEEGAGSTFTVWLPLGRRPASEPPPGRRRRTGRIAAAMAEEAMHWEPARVNDHAALGFGPGLDDPAPARNATPASVLVVDDNADMRDYLTRLLGVTWNVIEARTGDEALELAGRERPGIILAGAMTPKMDGFALLRRIRSDPAMERTPVILVTARAGENSAIEGMLAGADDYIVKPFSARELLARVDAQLKLSQVRRSADLAVRASEERLRRVLETERVGVLFFDQSGTLVDANDVFLQISGYTRAEVDNGELHWQTMTPPEWMPTSEKEMERLEATGRIGPYQKEYLCKDGTRKWMLFAGRDLGDGMISEFCIDITDLKLSEQGSPPG
jgi:PAS domain S-box-containing protein